MYCCGFFSSSFLKGSVIGIITDSEYDVLNVFIYLFVCLFVCRLFVCFGNVYLNHIKIDGDHTKLNYRKVYRFIS